MSVRSGALLLAVLLSVCLAAAGCRSESSTAQNDGAKWQADDDDARPRPKPLVELAPAANEAPADPPEPANGAATPPPPMPADPSPPPSIELPDPNHPFPRRVEAPEFPRDLPWINTAGPLRLRDLKGKFVLLDFWTYCCINCIHVLPELKKLEQQYPNELVVIGVHSAKFETERESENIAQAVMRYEIEHPVVNDSTHTIWNTYGVSSWPTILMIDPEGNAVWGRSGEFEAPQIAQILEVAIPYYRERGLLDETPLRFELAAYSLEPTPLRFPGKVLADEAGGRLFITDSNHHRIVVTDLAGSVQTIIGSGRAGAADGSFAEASFRQPQGCALHGETLYVADTENHLLRKIDLQQQTVTTIAGRGYQGRIAWPGAEDLGQFDEPPERWVGPPQRTAINSPWALWVHGDDLYIAMAGPHQIWKMPLDESEIGPYAGNGREDIVDGPLLPRHPYALGYSSFAQPSGLTSDGHWLYVADSEGSSIRAVPFDPAGNVRTVVGSAHLPRGRLFVFGDQDGEAEEVLLQHALGVAYHDGVIYTADTYNHKIKAIDAATGKTRTLAGDGQKGASDDPPRFSEPAGLSYAAGKLYVADTNNHLIRTIDLATGQVGTLALEGLAPPDRPPPSPPDFANAPVVESPAARLAPAEGAVRLLATLDLPAGWKLNPLAPMTYYVRPADAASPGVLDVAQLGGGQVLEPPVDAFDVVVPVTGEGAAVVEVGLIYYYCQEGAEGLCKVGSVLWRLPVTVAADGAPQPARLPWTVEP